MGFFNSLPVSPPWLLLCRIGSPIGEQLVNETDVLWNLPHARLEAPLDRFTSLQDYSVIFLARDETIARLQSKRMTQTSRNDHAPLLAKRQLFSRFHW